MTNDNHARRIAEAQVIGASLALVKKAGWTIQKHATVALAKDFWNYLYVPEPSLLLVPTIADALDDRQRRPQVRPSSIRRHLPRAMSCMIL